MTKTPARGAVPAVKINGNYVNIPGVDGVPRLGGGTKERYENTSIDAAARTYNTDLKTPPSLELSGSLDLTNEAHAYLLTSANNIEAVEDFQVTFNSGAKAHFNGEVLAMDIEAIGGKDERFYMPIQITGAVNVTAS